MDKKKKGKKTSETKDDSDDKMIEQPVQHEEPGSSKQQKLKEKGGGEQVVQHEEPGPSQQKKKKEKGGGEQQVVQHEEPAPPPQPMQTQQKKKQKGSGKQPAAQHEEQGLPEAKQTQQMKRRGSSQQSDSSGSTGQGGDQKGKGAAKLGAPPTATAIPAGVQYVQPPPGVQLPTIAPFSQGPPRAVYKQPPPGAVYQQPPPGVQYMQQPPPGVQFQQQHPPGAWHQGPPPGGLYMQPPPGGPYMQPPPGVQTQPPLKMQPPQQQHQPTPLVQQQFVRGQSPSVQSPQGSSGLPSPTESPAEQSQGQGGGRGGRGAGRGGRGGAWGGRGGGQDGQGRGPTDESRGPDPGVAQTRGARGAGRGTQSRGRGGRGGQQQVSQTPTIESSPGDIKELSVAMSKTSTSGKGDGIVILDKIQDGGKTGRQIAVHTNHFPLKMGKIKKVIHYDITIDPNRPKKMMKDVYLRCRDAYFKGYNPAFDGNKNIMSSRELPFGDAVSGTVQIEELNSRPKEFKVSIKRVAVIDLGDLDRFFNQIQSRRVMEAPMSAIQAIDIVLRHSLLMNNITVGRSFFTPPQGGIIDLGNGMEMYRGFFQSVTLGWKPYLNVDVANKAFPIAKNVIDLINILCRPDLNKPLERWNVETVQKYIKNLRIEYNLPNQPSARKRYRVNGVDEPSNVVSFKMNDNPRPITVAEYYKTEKKCPLRYPNMPCLWVGGLNSQIKVRIPCELCTILPGQAVNRKLDANQTREMIKQCATNTKVRKDSIMQSIRLANYNQDPVVREFDLQISPNFAQIDARVLVPPTLKYSQKIVSVRRGTWNAETFFNAAALSSWTILNTDNRTRDESLNELENMVVKIGKRLGVAVPNATRPFSMIRYDPRKMLDNLKMYFKQQKGKVQLIFVVIPEQDRIYNYVKQAAEIAVGCLTQCIKSKTVYSKMNDATVTNILLKVNAKLNGLNHTLNVRPPIMDQPTMLMGADVTHPSPDARDIPSVAAVTASHDPKAFKYNICWRLQPPTVEIIADLENITREHLMFFYQQTKVQPKRIVFYRDGVSNGQFEQVLNAELQAIRRACSRLNESYKPSITFIVVQKRHHTRFFPVNERDSEDRNCNVPAGTCVDTEITHPTRQNFFLVSHASIQGVAKPTKYVTLWDDNDFKTDDLENLTYYLCHMFARCTRSVSYPAPTYYAHLAAARAKVYCETERLNMDKLEMEQNRMNIQNCIVKELPMFFV